MFHYFLLRVRDFSVRSLDRNPGKEYSSFLEKESDNEKERGILESEARQTNSPKKVNQKVQDR